jgi:hypothetical protein
MGYYVANGLGDSITEPTVEQMRAFLDDLDPTDEEHGAAWLSNDSEWSLEWSPDGLLVLSRGEDDSRHMTGISKEATLELWMSLVEERFEAIEAHPWLPSSRPPMAPEEIEERQRTFATWQLADDRKFYDLLGEERANVKCRREPCTRGAIVNGVFCRRHHFESIRNRVCPFSE